MTIGTKQTGIVEIDDSPMVHLRKPQVRAEDRDGDGRVDVYLYDFNNDGTPDVEHSLHDRRTFVMLPRSMPWAPAPTVTHHTGEQGDVPLRVTFRASRLGELLFELNGFPSFACLSLDGMLSLGIVWNADREHADELQAAQHFWLGNGGVGGFERRA